MRCPTRDQGARHGRSRSCVGEVELLLDPLEAGSQGVKAMGVLIDSDGDQPVAYGEVATQKTFPVIDF